MPVYSMELMFKASVIVLAAYAATAALRKSSAATRHMIWATALICLLVLPVAAWVAPQWKARIPQAVQPATSLALTVVTVHGDAERMPVRDFLYGVWLAGTGILLLRAVMGYLSALGIARRAEAMSHEDARSPRISHEIDVPMVCGLRRPVILLPGNARSWPAALRSVALRHEEAHIVRRDPLWQAVSDAARALYWPLPWVWWAVARLRAEAELACDDAVLLSGERASDYAGHLIDIVRELPGPERIPDGAIPMARLSYLETRLRAVLSAHPSRNPVGRHIVLCAAIAALCLLTPLAALRVSAGAADATISGVVQDASGARVPGAKVLLTFPGEDRKEITATNPAGEFSFSPLPDGEYQIQVREPGFALLELKNIVVANGRSEPLLIVLQSGKIHESVTVMGDRPAVARVQAPSQGTPHRIKVGGNLQNTKLLYKVNPAYPPGCKAEGVEGSVLLRAVISRDGSVVDIKALNQLVDQRLVAAAIDAVKQWRYEPTLLNGEPIQVVTDVEVHFVLR